MAPRKPAPEPDMPNEDELDGALLAAARGEGETEALELTGEELEGMLAAGDKAVIRAPELFEGEAVRGVVLKVTGGVDDQLLQHLGIGEHAVLVVTGAVASVAFSEEKNVLKRMQTVKASDVFVVADAMDAADLVQKLRADRKRQLDELLGTDPLPGIDEPANGVSVSEVTLDGIPETDAEWDDALRDVSPDAPGEPPEGG